MQEMNEGNVFVASPKIVKTTTLGTNTQKLVYSIEYFIEYLLQHCFVMGACKIAQKCA